MFTELESSNVWQEIKSYGFVGVGIFLLGLAISGFGLLQLFSNSVQASQELVTTQSASLVNTCQKDPNLGLVVVDISGAVKKPGIYELESGSRINDAVEKAGGFSWSVDKYYLNKSFNLSTRLKDGDKIYIPTLDDSIKEYEKKGNNEVNQSKENVNALVSINTATKEELTSLVGIGDKRADDIVSSRPYSSIEELVDKKVLGTSVFEKIKNRLEL